MKTLHLCCPQKMNRGKQTEEKIKQAAEQLFRQKGFSSVKTREIAGAAGINLALLNYYFRSKENLFQVIMLENMKTFMQKIAGIMMEKESSFYEKREKIVSAYHDILQSQPELPLFILNNLYQHPEVLFREINPRSMIMQSVFVNQYKQEVKKKKLPDISFVQYFSNLMGLILFPYIAAPMLRELSETEHDFNQMLAERKKWIPLWMASMDKTTLP